MSKGAYTYEPGNITEFGKDRMRFELGDTMVEGLADTTALTDEEIQAAIDAYPNKWKRAKLMLLESLCRRFAYEVNTKTGPLSLDMNGRAKLWKEDYDKLKKEVQAESVSVPRFGNVPAAAGASFCGGRPQAGLHDGRRETVRTGAYGSPQGQQGSWRPSAHAFRAPSGGAVRGSLGRTRRADMHG